MGRLLYSAIVSLDGYVADRDGTFDWSAPDEEVHAAVNDLVRPVTTHLYGRRMYDVLVAWETLDASDSPAMQDFAHLWRSAEKVVFSRTLPEPASRRTRIEREFDPASVQRMKASSDGDLAVGGPELAGLALRAGLVDEVHLFVSPVVVGGGTAAFADDVHVSLDLRGARRFDNGVVHLHHAVRG